MNPNGEIIPGCWTCPTCGFGLVKNILYTKSGNVGPNEEPFVERCPNDGAFMVPETYKMRCESLSKICEQLLREMNWLDQHCSFVVDAEYNIGPFRIGQLRFMAQDGIKADELKEQKAAQ